MSGLDAGKVKEKLDGYLEGTPWKYRYWERDGLIELRNISSELPDEEIKERMDEIMSELETENNFVHLLDGKLGLVRENGKLWKDGIDSDGEPLGHAMEVDESEARKLMRDALGRVDNKIFPTNMVEFSPEKVLEIYTEDVGSESFIHLNMEEDWSITLRDDGGIQIRASL